MGFFLIISLLNCKSLLVRKDYQGAKDAWADTNPELAFERFPSGESGQFITTLEKAHIGFLKDKFDYSDLAELAETSKERLRFSASRELRSFFYLETGEGYYASEAEIIYMHILLGLYFARDKQFEKAAIEARYAGNLLSGEWSAEGQFDDPTLRVLLASLWLSCGNWEEARVDFKKASILAPENKNLRSLSNMKVAPAGFTLIFGGPGAEPVIKTKPNLN
ncbi:hypothetical protein EHQ58_06820 [Leptospira ognonensis]|uniref:Tetratricopeptide repeat protein n=1 Tax=Leptospira ognonensis TaxID=2484945 RepID=A0A4R9K6L1_9LEPT|nr:hypothetical protein [Leptospira ognonensis]TGL60207.1 hypothetical protein EHQ58_06820 [Leptospira ognonensis]